MLYFSKLKLVIIYFIIIFLSLFSFLNFIEVKEHKLMVQALKRGDEVITAGGIVGKIERILGDDKVELLISENITVEVVQSTIQSLLKKPDTKK